MSGAVLTIRASTCRVAGEDRKSVRISPREHVPLAVASDGPRPDDDGAEPAWAETTSAAVETSAANATTNMRVRVAMQAISLVVQGREPRPAGAPEGRVAPGSTERQRP